MDSKLPVNLQAYAEITLENVANRRSMSIEQVRSIIQQRYDIYAVVATPKSGSTFLSNVLSKSQNLPYIPLCYAYSSNEHDLYFPALVTAASTGAVSQLHMKATPHNVQLLNFFGIQPIVLTRNIFDSVESLARDLRKKCLSPMLGKGVDGYSFTWLTQDTANLNDEQLIDFVIDFALPWYVNFYVSWHSLASEGLINPLFLRYEDLMKDKKKEVMRVIDEIGDDPIEVDPSILDENYIGDSVAISRGTGESGQGMERLTGSQIKAIKRLLSYYPTIDFDEWLE